MPDLNPIKIASIISDSDERDEVERLIAEYRKQLLGDLTYDLWKLREFKYKEGMRAYAAITNALAEFKKYE